MKRFALFAALALGVLVACSPTALQLQAQLANGVALAANRGLPSLVQQYAAEGAAAIDAAPDQAAATHALEAVTERWRAVWGDCGTAAIAGCQGGAWRVLQLAQATWADAIDRGRDGGVSAADLAPLAGRLLDAYCALRSALPPGATLPDVPVLACTAPSTASDGGLDG